MTTALAAGLALLWTADAFAAGKKRQDSDQQRTYQSRNDQPVRTRSNTVAANGLCQRDTGTHNSNLDFRNKCDTEEFWLRQQRGRGGR